MMTSYPVRIRSAAALRLVENGDSATQDNLDSAVGCLSDASLSSLEDELDFFAQTGFVGNEISQLLSGLHRVAARLVA